MPISIPAAITSALDALESPSREIAKRAIRNLFDKAFITMPDGELFVQTGDIPAMWIRDSSWQVLPIVRFASDPDVFDVIHRVIRAQVKFLNLDPYANAFNIAPNGLCWHKDFADQSDWVFERKWELDSITGFLQLSLDLLRSTGRDDHLDAEWWSLAASLVELLDSETRHEPASYRFWREGAPSHDHLANGGFGAPYKHCGLIWSAFRPSDDSCDLPFNIPANIHAYLMLTQLASVAAPLQPKLAKDARALAGKLNEAIEQHGTAMHKGRKIYAYEVDGLGGTVLMDDANYPSLVSLPFHGYQRDEIYDNTRAFATGAGNPWYFEGSEISGVGSPHTGVGRVWPLAVAMAGITATSSHESFAAEELIAQTATADLHIHESIAADDHLDFTREWFNWAELTFVELALKNHSLRVR